MRFLWRKKQPGDFDHETVWSLVALAVFGAARLLPADGIGVSVCWFHALTGKPCPSCGSTRTFIAIAHGRWIEGFAWNPLAGVFFAGLAFYVAYSAIVLAFRRPRLRVEFTSARERIVLIAVLAAAVMVNWAFVIRAGKI
jgi:hypothetical protein